MQHQLRRTAEKQRVQQQQDWIPAVQVQYFIPEVDKAYHHLSLQLVAALGQHLFNIMMPTSVSSALAAWMAVKDPTTESALVEALVTALPTHEGCQVVRHSVWGGGLVIVSQEIKAYWMYRLAVLGVSGLHANTRTAVLTDALAQVSLMISRLWIIRLLTPCM